MAISSADAPAGAPLIRVVIATTRAPVEVSRLVAIPGESSVICRHGTTEQVGISYDGHYSDFVRDGTGIIHRLFGGGSFRMDVRRLQVASAGQRDEPAEITSGDSWQAGAFLAHAAASQDRLARDGQTPGAVVWVSGAVDVHDMSIRPVDGLADKMRVSLDALAALKGAGSADIWVCLPAANQADFMALDADLRQRFTACASGIWFPATLGELLERVRLHRVAASLPQIRRGGRQVVRIALFVLLCFAGTQLLHINLGRVPAELGDALTTHWLEPPRLGYLEASYGGHMLMLLRPARDQARLGISQGRENIDPDQLCQYEASGDCAFGKGPGALRLFNLDPRTTGEAEAAREIVADVDHCPILSFHGDPKTHHVQPSSDRSPRQEELCPGISRQDPLKAQLDILTHYDAVSPEISLIVVFISLACVVFLSAITMDVVFLEMIDVYWAALRLVRQPRRHRPLR